MSLFSDPLTKAVERLEASPKTGGWPIWSTKTGRRYVLLRERDFKELAERAGYEITNDGVER
jgi:hypothetical protein